jgi:F-type H+-transporting ATPase subunit b
MTIDWWTLGFQTVNVAILIWLLGHFFWKPVAAMIVARKAATQKLTDEAGAAKTKADAALADIEKTRAGFASERDAILAAAHKDAEDAHAARLAEAETEAAAHQAKTKAALDKAKAAQADAWADRSSDLAVTIARRLAARLEGAVVEACFLDWLVAEIGKLPKATREAAATKTASLEATTATTLDADARQLVKSSIGKALGCTTPHITFKTDDGLIAGIELRGDHLVVNSSWRADLAAIAVGLKPGPAA